jgi:hypothetical protein
MNKPDAAVLHPACFYGISSNLRSTTWTLPSRLTVM